MKKKISLFLCMLVMILSFTGCASKEALEYDEASIEQVTEFLISYCMSSDEATIEQWESMSEFSLEQQLTEAGLPLTPESFLGALESWQAGLSECGAYVQHGDYTYEAAHDELVVTTPVVFEERNATLKFVFDDKLFLETMTVSGEYSMGEILQKAGLNTILGMGTVFAVLIFIAFIIYLFKYIPVIEDLLKGKKKNNVTEAAPVEAVKAAAPAEAEDVTDDLELVAVIAAAIAAAEGTTTDAFVVRSIKRRPSNKWRA